MLVRDLMTENPTAVRETDSIAAAISVLERLDVRHVPVVDGSGALVGMISDRDIRCIVGPYPALDPELRIRLGWPITRAMTGDVATVDADADASDAIDTMLEQKVGALPVVDADGDFVGIVSYVDLLRELGSALAQ